jgi:hypothetical protein
MSGDAAVPATVSWPADADQFLDARTDVDTAPPEAPERFAAGERCSTVLALSE